MTKRRVNMEIVRPYFMTNKKWYFFDDDAVGDAHDRSIKLTDEGRADEKVRTSYEEYYDSKYDDDLFACGE